VRVIEQTELSRIRDSWQNLKLELDQLSIKTHRPMLTAEWQFETQVGGMDQVAIGGSIRAATTAWRPTIVEVAGCAGRRLVARLAARCGPAALTARFFRPVRPAANLDVVGLLLGPADGIALLAIDAGRPVGLLNLAPDAGGEVNIALLVADAWQRRGIARALLDHALADPRWAHRDLYATVRPDNTAVRKLLRSLPRTVRLVDTAPGELYLKLSPPDESLRLASS
jgi:GNAT superfamily N-acetyltransferase